MTVYYKATRPDGTDFYSGTIEYVPGRTVRPRRADNPKICGPGFLHAADVPAETLVGGSWPCRLFEVTGRPAAGFDCMHPHKGGFLELRVVAEIPAELALGPNGTDVVALIDAASRLTVEDVAARGAAPGAAWAAARAAAWAAARAAALGAALDAARAAALDAARAAAWDAARAAALDAARAAAALVLRDLISAKHFDVLYGAWKQLDDIRRKGPVA